jgi:hypothetical protein
LHSTVDTTQAVDNLKDWFHPPDSTFVDMRSQQVETADPWRPLQ